MNNATKRQLKQQDQFITFTEHGVDWANQNRTTAILVGVAAIALILILVGAFSLYQHRTAAAATAFGDAMKTYQRPLADQAAQLQPGTKTFPDAKTRATEANAQFMAVAHQYGMTEPGKMALYMGGVTYAESGNYPAAEDALKTVAGSWNGEVAALGDMALAGLYQQTGKFDQAAQLLEKIAHGHATTVPPYLAQIQLGELYQSEGKTAEAKRVWAQVKDKDKDSKGNPGPAGQIAAEKLNPQAVTGALPPR